MIIGTPKIFPHGEVNNVLISVKVEATVVLWLIYWLLAEQELRGSIPGLAATISEVCFLLLPSRGYGCEIAKAT